MSVSDYLLGIGFLFGFISLTYYVLLFLSFFTYLLMSFTIINYDENIFRIFSGLGLIGIFFARLSRILRKN